MNGASGGGAPFRSRVTQLEDPPTGSRSRGGGSTQGDDVVIVSVKPALHETMQHRDSDINPAGTALPHKEVLAY